MKPENMSSSLIVLFISIYLFALANTQSSSATDNSPATLAQDEPSNRKSEEDHVEEEDDSLNFISPSDKRRIGSEFLGKRTIPSFHGYSFEKRKALGSEFLGKRKLGSEFLGKRSENTQQQHPEDYQFFYSNVPEDEDYSSSSVTNNKAGLAPFPMHQYPMTRYTTNNQQYYKPNPYGQSGYGGDDSAWMNKLQSLKRGIGSEFLGKRDIYRPSSFNLINKWTRSYGPRLPIEHDKKRKLMGSEFLG